MSKEGVSKADLAKMRMELAEHEAENMSHGELIDLLIEGFEGYDSMDESELYDMYMRFITS